MKIIIKSIIAVVVFFAATNFVNATQPVLNVIGDNTILLSIDKLSSDIKINLTDKYGYSLYSENVKAEKDQFRKRISVEALPNGIYKLEIEDNLQVVSLSIKIEDNKIVGNEIGNELNFKPVVYKKGENIYISQFTLEKEPLKVVIYNGEDEVVFEETLTGKVDLGRIYSFQKSGEYTLALESNNKTFKHTVSINN